jgi:hypothetical protein
MANACRGYVTGWLLVLAGAHDEHNQELYVLHSVVGGGGGVAWCCNYSRLGLCIMRLAGRLRVYACLSAVF